MKMLGILIAVALTLSALGGTVYAARDNLPGDALYPVKAATEQVVMRFAGNDIARAERGLVFAERRLDEIAELVAQGRVQDLELAVEKYGNALNITMTRIEAAIARGRVAGNVTGNVTARVAEATLKHLYVLEEVYEKVPEQAKPAIARAMERSVTGHHNAVAALKRAGLDDSRVPGIPEAVRERLRDILDGIPPAPGPPIPVSPGPPNNGGPPGRP